MCTVLFQLLRDEQVENEKRVLAMDKRVQDLRKMHGLLPGNQTARALHKQDSISVQSVFLTLKVLSF